MLESTINKMILTYWTVQLIFMISMHLKFGKKMSVLIYAVSFATMLLYPIMWILIWRIMIDFLVLLSKHDKLLINIRHILEVFPESVIIIINILILNKFCIETNRLIHFQFTLVNSIKTLKVLINGGSNPLHSCS